MADFEIRIPVTTTGMLDDGWTEAEIRAALVARLNERDLSQISEDYPEYAFGEATAVEPDEDTTLADEWTAYCEPLPGTPDQG